MWVDVTERVKQDLPSEAEIRVPVLDIVVVLVGQSLE
jgi:hypothetical protein